MTNCTGRLDEVRAASRSNWKSDSLIVSAGVRRVKGFQTGLSWIPACQTAFYTVLISRGQWGNSPPSCSSSRLLPSVPPLPPPTPTPQHRHLKVKSLNSRFLNAHVRQ